MFEVYLKKVGSWCLLLFFTKLPTDSILFLLLKVLLYSPNYLLTFLVVPVIVFYFLWNWWLLYVQRLNINLT